MLDSALTAVLVGAVAAVAAQPHLLPNVHELNERVRDWPLVVLGHALFIAFTRLHRGHILIPAGWLPSIALFLFEAFLGPVAVSILLGVGPVWVKLSGHDGEVLVSIACLVLVASVQKMKGWWNATWLRGPIALLEGFSTARAMIWAMETSFAVVSESMTAAILCGFVAGMGAVIAADIEDHSRASFLSLHEWGMYDVLVTSVAYIALRRLGVESAGLAAIITIPFAVVFAVRELRAISSAPSTHNPATHTAADHATAAHTPATAKSSAKTHAKQH